MGCASSARVDARGTGIDLSAKPKEPPTPRHVPASSTLEFPNGIFAARASTDYGATYTVELTASGNVTEVHISPAHVDSYPHTVSIWLDFESPDRGFAVESLRESLSDIHTFHAPGDRFSALTAVPFGYVEKCYLTVRAAFGSLKNVNLLLENLGDCIELLRNGPFPSTVIESTAMTLGGSLVRAYLENDVRVVIDIARPFNLCLIYRERMMISGHRVTAHFGEKWLQKGREIYGQLVDDEVY
jgi:hypothetical protein